VALNPRGRDLLCPIPCINIIKIRKSGRHGSRLQPLLWLLALGPALTKGASPGELAFRCAWSSLRQSIRRRFIRPGGRAEYTKTYRDPARVHAICEEYRAAATLDVEHDEKDQRDSSRIKSPHTKIIIHRMSSMCMDYVVYSRNHTLVVVVVTGPGCDSNLWRRAT
jgi:hypothetical protein